MWPGWMAWQVERRIIEANLQASKTTAIVLILWEQGLRRLQSKTVLQALFEQTTHQLAFRRSRQRWECQICKHRMGETSLVRWLRAGPCSGEDPNHAEYWKLTWYGGAAGSCGDIHSNWVDNRTSLAFSDPISRCYVMDFPISVQIEHATFGRGQGVGTGRFEQNQAGIPASCKDELAVTCDGI